MNIKVVGIVNNQVYVAPFSPNDSLHVFFADYWERLQLQKQGVKKYPHLYHLEMELFGKSTQDEPKNKR